MHYVNLPKQNLETNVERRIEVKRGREAEKGRERKRRRKKRVISSHN
jgi:hypothetical protein